MATKRQRHLNQIIKCLVDLDEPTMIPNDRDKRRRALAEAILDAVQDPPPKPRRGGDGTANSRVIGMYCDMWRAKYRSQKNPPVTRQIAGQMARVVGDLGEERTVALLAAYFAMPDGFVLKNRHPVNLFVTRLTEVAAFAETGDFLSASQSRNMEKGAGIASTLEKIERGEL